MLRHADATWTSPKVIAMLALIFLCGAAFGSALTRGYIRSHWPTPPSPSPVIERARHVGLGTLKAKLNLTPAQEQAITKILDDYGKFYQNIEDEREDVAQDGSRRILEALSPEQKQRFLEILGRPPR